MGGRGPRPRGKAADMVLPGFWVELERIKAEEDKEMEQVKNVNDLQGNGSGDDNPSGDSGKAKENVDVKTPSV